MITCANCESPQFLQIDSSRILFERRWNSSSIDELEEHYQCTFCGAEGKYVYEDGQGSISGDVEEVSDPVVPQ